jgi:ribosomal protein S12 methylthiotransferase
MNQRKKLTVLPEKENSSKAQSCGNSLNVVTPQSPNVFLKSQSYLGNVAFVTLGCAKNQVDSEVMVGVLRKEGFEIVPDLKSADVIVVNTCGFLESAIQESIDAVLNAAEYRKEGRLRRLIVAGCMVERFKGDIATALPEVDAFLAINDILQVGEVAKGSDFSILKEAGRPYFLYDDAMPRGLSTAGHYAYVKISEGCNRPCTFCIIPKIRGTMRSRELDSVVNEVKSLVAQGVKEINLVAQDLTAFGSDSSTKDSSIELLLKRLDAESGATWIRLLYAYPLGIKESLLKTIVALPTVCDYLDIPLQHVSESVLRNMKRPLGKYSPATLTDFMKQTAPEIALRTTFIVGFPGETLADVDELSAFVGKGYFHSAGVFCYSKEEGTESFDLTGQISKKDKERRRKSVMESQQHAVGRMLEKYINTTHEVILEGDPPQTELLLTGRTCFQAPEVDGVTLINDIDPEIVLQKGDLYKVEITEILGYDLVGRIVDKNEKQYDELLFNEKKQPFVVNKTI